MENLHNIKKAVKDNNGATLTSTGEYARISTGYIVSENKHGLIMSLAEFNGLTLARFNALLRKARRLGALLGFWLNGGRVYIDFNKHINDKKQALAYGYEQAQLAIWDCANMCEIALTGDKSEK